MLSHGGRRRGEGSLSLLVRHRGYWAMIASPSSLTKDPTDTATTSLQRYVSVCTTNERVVGEIWNRPIHTRARTNTACPSVPTHLHPFLSVLSLKHFVFSLSLSRIISIPFSVLLILGCSFPSRTLLGVSLPLIVGHAQCRGELTRFPVLLYGI